MIKIIPVALLLASSVASACFVKLPITSTLVYVNPQYVSSVRIKDERVVTVHQHVDSGETVEIRYSTPEAAKRGAEQIVTALSQCKTVK